MTAIDSRRGKEAAEQTGGESRSGLLHARSIEERVFGLGRQRGRYLGKGIKEGRADASGRESLGWPQTLKQGGKRSIKAWMF